MITYIFMNIHVLVEIGEQKFRRDSRKGDKMLDEYLGPYEVVEDKQKGIYCLKNI